MQSNRLEVAVFLIGLLIGIASGLIAWLAHEVFAVLLLEFMAGAVLGFSLPRGAWRGALALALWVPVALLLKAPLEPSAAYSWCHTHTVSTRLVAWTLFAAPFAAVYAGVTSDWIVSRALRWLEFLRWRWLAYVKTALRISAVGLAGCVTLGAGVLLAQPLRPYSTGQRYCWDEYCFSVLAVKRTQTIGSGVHRAVAGGTFYIVTAKMETPWWGRFDWSSDAVYVTDYDGVDYRYSPHAQETMDALNKSTRSRCHEILGASEVETIVFDLPQNITQPRLLVRDTLGVEGLLDSLRSNLFPLKPAFNLRYD